MSEHQSLPTSSDSPLISTEADQSAPPQEDWETAAIPGTIDGVQNLTSTSAIAPERESELLALIHDLNQCNDALLSRVTQLERALEKSQSALKSEVANAQAANGKMAQQVSVEQASAQQISQNAQQQIGKLVSELDNTEQALNRQTLINENLQTEVSNNQERIAQLERECTIVAQQHLEEVQTRAKAESASKDLRSRLQRQQRYTMQFKAALEKSLTVTERSTSPSTAQPISFQDSTAVAMPKAQRIMPWVSDSSSPFAGIDPHLESLIRGVGKSKSQAEDLNAGGQKEVAAAKDVLNDSENKASAGQSVAPRVEQTTHSEAEDKLWQDLERVMDQADDSQTDKAQADKSTKAQTADVVLDDAVLDAANTITPDAQTADTASTTSADSIKVETESATPEDASDSDELIHQIERSFSTASREVPEETVAFTEPSPWGAPLSETQSDKKLEKIAAGVETRLVRHDPDVSSAEASSAADRYLPAVDSKASAAVSPLVKPLRSQKKTGSLSDIELPTFQNAKVASFRR